jgi:FAD:protein FMN transferase
VAPSRQTLRSRLANASLAELDDGFYEVIFLALGSECQLLFGAGNSEQAEAYRAAAFEWLIEFEARYSRFLPDSDLSRVNSNAGIGWVEISAEFELLLDLCGQFQFITQGAFDASSLPLSQLWDWKRQHDSLPSAQEIAAARALTGWSLLERTPGRLFLPKPGMLLDLGGIGKEFAVDALRQLAIKMGLSQVLVDLGGDIATHGSAPEGAGWAVGLEDPSKIGDCYCTIRLRNGAAVATSGDYRRCFELGSRTFGHILDCRTGWPVANGTRAATVIAPRCLQAGLLSTSAMVLGGTDAIAMLERTPSVEGCLWWNGQLLETRGFRRAALPSAWHLQPNCTSHDQNSLIG